MTFFYRFKKNKKIFYKNLINFLENILIYTIIRESFNRISSSVKGHYNAITQTCFYKISVQNKSFFLKEQNNISAIRTKYTEISCIVPPYEYKNIYKNKILMMRTKKLTPISDEKELFRSAKEILNVLKKYSNKRSCQINELYNVQEGLKIIKYFSEDQIYKSIYTQVNQFVENNLFDMGPCHGDFHSGNILKDANNKSYIIDLDCFRENSIQEIDALYFVVQYIADNNAISWYKALTQLLTKENNDYTSEFSLNDNKNMHLLYFLDRIGQDLQYIGTINVFLKNEIINTAKKLTL